MARRRRRSEPIYAEVLPTGEESFVVRCDHYNVPFDVAAGMTKRFGKGWGSVGFVVVRDCDGAVLTSTVKEA